MTTYVRHSIAISWCVISDETGPSIVTHCRGRFSKKDTYERSAETPIANRCGACEQRVRELEQIERGLKELEQYEAGFAALHAAINLATEGLDEYEREHGYVDGRFDHGGES